MSIAANRFPGVRAALCCSPRVAELARTHNDANVLVLAGTTGADELARILDAWLRNSYSGEERHRRRLRKVEAACAIADDVASWEAADPEMAAAIRGEVERQQRTINLIASENYVSPAVRMAQGSVMTNKYAEGYPAKRWYNGCRWVDEAERLAIERARALFGAEHANVQPHSGSGANMAVYFSVLKPGDTILAMSLSHGGHLTHGSPVNFSGRLFNIVSYGVNPKTETIDYDELARLANQHRPKIVLAGASAYPRLLDFPRFREIADRVGAMLVVDMAHIAGLVAGGCHPNPVPYAEFVTSTTHKTLRGPRGGLILCREPLAQELDRQIFPGIQGGPLMHTVAAKAVCFLEAGQPAFREYALQIVRNAAAMAQVFLADGFRLVSGGTENHLMLVDLTPEGISGKDAASLLERVGIIVNKNTIPFEQRSPFVTSGIRIGTPAITTRGMRETESIAVARIIRSAIRHRDDESTLERLRGEVAELTQQFPAP
jgi:glycine hydroxymethyltransferase